MTCPFVIAGPARRTGLIRSLTARCNWRVPSRSCRASNRTGTQRPCPNRSNAMNMLSETVDVIIGVDTHKHTHTAAVVRAATGAERV